MRCKDAEERVCDDEERRGRGSTVLLNGTGFILHLRTSGTFAMSRYADGWRVKVVLLVNGGNARLKRAFAAKIRSLLANKPTVSPATSIPIIAFQ